MFHTSPRLPHGQSVTSCCLAVPTSPCSGRLYLAPVGLDIAPWVQGKMCACTELGVLSGARVAILVTNLTTFEVRVPKQTFEMLMSVSLSVKRGFCPFAFAICITNFPHGIRDRECVSRFHNAAPVQAARDVTYVLGGGLGNTFHSLRQEGT